MRALALILPLGLLLGSGLAPAQADPRIPDRFWGMADPTMQLSDKLPVGSVHLGTEASWVRVERHPGDFQWDHADELIDAAHARGLRPMIILGNTPSFHVADPSDPATDRTQMPDLEAWKTFVREAVGRYGGTVDYIVWNEPNVDIFWTGTPDEIALVTRAAARIVQTQAPKAQVLMGTMPVRLESQREWILDYAKALTARKAWRYLDAIPLDPYPLPDQGPEDAAALVRTMRDLFASVGVHKPFWIAEINYGVPGGGQPSATTLSPRRQAAYVMRTYLLMADEGVRRVHWFKWEPFEDIGVQMSTPDGHLTDASRALIRVHRWMGATRFAGCRTLDHRVRVCTGRQGNEVRRVYWRPTGSATIHTPASTRRWHTMEGKVTKKRGRFRLEVGQAPVLVVSRH